MERLFGTDGIRAIAGQAPLDHPTIYCLGEALVSLLKEKGLEPRVLVGQNTRESGKWIEEALFQGIQEAQGEETGHPYQGGDREAPESCQRYHSRAGDRHDALPHCCEADRIREHEGWRRKVERGRGSLVHSGGEDWHPPIAACS